VTRTALRPTDGATTSAYTNLVRGSRTATCEVRRSRWKVRLLKLLALSPDMLNHLSERTNTMGSKIFPPLDWTKIALELSV
jgi:hypothetical protein